MCRHTSTHTMALHRVTLILLLALFASFVGPVPLTYAATISVACADVAGLVAAITTANTNGVDDVISLAAGCTYTLTTSDNNAFGSNGLPVIVPDGNLTIQGNGATIRRDPASPFFRLLCVSGGGGQGTQTSLTISGLTMSGGDSEGEGGAIYARYTDLLITESTFSSNRSAYSGGAIDTMDANGRISASTFSANSAREGGAVAITVDGGGTIDIINSTFSGNLAIDDGGAIYDTGGLTSLTHSTIAGNTSDSDSDGIGDAAVRGSGVSLYSTIIAENIDLSPVDIFPDIVGSVTSNGYNIIGVDDPPTLATNTGDHVGTSAAPINPLLGALTDNGGPTLTRALLPGSPALDAGDPTLPPLPTTDQRGTGFPRVVGVIDIGAFEAAPAIAVYLGATSAGTPLTNGQATAVAFGTTLVGTPVLRSFTIRNTGSANLSLGALTLPAGYALVGTFPGGPVAPSSEVSFQVQLNAAATGTVSGTLSFVNGAAAQTPFVFPLSGTVTAPTIAVYLGSSAATGTALTNGQPTAVDFGSTLVGTPVLRSFTIRNTGSANLSLGALTLPAGYALVGTFPGGPVAPSSEVSFQVQLNAAATGTVSGTLSFVNGAAAQTPFVFPLSGTVTAPTIAVYLGSSAATGPDHRHRD